METKKCSYCGGEILAAAKKCKHCGKWFAEESATATKSSVSPVPVVIVNPPESEPKRQGFFGKYKFAAGIAVGFILFCLVSVLLYVLFPDEALNEQTLYLRDMMQPTANYSTYVGVATDDFGDRLASGKGGFSGDLQIVIHTISAPEKLQPVLKGSELEFAGDILDVYPSTKYPDVVYFGGYKWDDSGEYDESSPFYGKIDIKSKKHGVYDGKVYGMIRRGKYKDCYLAQRGERLLVFPQSPVGEAYDYLTAFEPKKMFGDVELYDPAVQQSILRWVENQ